MGAEFARPRATRKKTSSASCCWTVLKFRDGAGAGQRSPLPYGHMSAWELAPFAQALFGYPLHFLVRAIDNPRVDSLVTRYRCLSGTLPLRRINRRERVLKFSLRAHGRPPGRSQYATGRRCSWIFSAFRRVRRRDWLDLLYIRCRRGSWISSLG